MSELEELSESRSKINEEKDEFNVIEIKGSNSNGKLRKLIFFLIVLILGLAISLSILCYKLYNNNTNNINNKSNSECPESNVILQDTNGHVFNLAEYIHNIQENLGVNMTFKQTYQLVDDFLYSFSSLSIKKNESGSDTDNQDSLLDNPPDFLNIYNNNDEETRRLQAGNRVCTNSYGFSSNNNFFYLVSGGFSVIRTYTFYSTQINGICLLFSDNNLLCSGSLTGSLYIASASSQFCVIDFCVGTNFIESIQYQACNGFIFPLLGGPGGSCYTVTPNNITLDAIYGYTDPINNIITAIGFCYSTPP